MNTDPIADFLTRLRNANRAGHKTVIIPISKMKKEITKILLIKDLFLIISLMMRSSRLN